MSIQITLYLDTRREKKDGFSPVKLRVWDSQIKKAKLYPVNMDFSQKDFHLCWESKKPRKEYREQRLILEQVLANANKIANKLEFFSFEEFERKLLRRSGDGTNIFWHYEKIILEKYKNKNISTAQSYENSLDSIKAFLVYKGSKNAIKLFFYEITPNWLNEYESYMTGTLNRSLTTVGIYLRNLRAVFNSAIEDNEIQKEIYPFGKRKYQIPAPRNKKKALTNDQLKTLFETQPDSPEQQKAKDFFFFSYSCNGMNIKDIAQLRHKDIKDGAVTFYRAKTINTSKANLKPITAYLNDYTNEIIRKYGNSNKNQKELVFDIITDTQTAMEQKRKIGNFIRFVNQHLKILCKKIGLPEDISTYWARHSFATNAIRKGASIEFIQETLGHGNPKTTMNYFAGFDDESKREFAKHLMEF